MVRARQVALVSRVSIAPKRQRWHRSPLRAFSLHTNIRISRRVLSDIGIGADQLAWSPNRPVSTSDTMTKSGEIWPT